MKENNAHREEISEATGSGVSAGSSVFAGPGEATGSGVSAGSSVFAGPGEATGSGVSAGSSAFAGPGVVAGSGVSAGSSVVTDSGVAAGVGSSCFKPLKHRDSRRMFSHDYCSRGFYLITSTACQGSPAFSSMPGCALEQLKIKDGEMIMPIHTELGDCIKKEILEIPLHHPELRIIRFVIMPDHIHIVMEVKERLNKKLGRLLAGFFGACSKHMMRIRGASELKTLFSPFNDKVILNYQQLDRAIKYVEDNPRRLIIKRQFPNLFKRYLHLNIGDHEYAAYGNIFLLKEINLLPVRIHRRWSEAEFNDYRTNCRKEISNGAIPISPAIHKVEREIIEEAFEMGGSVILLRDQGFEERFKPKGKKFDLCTEGRLLLLAPWPENTGRKSDAGYVEFHKMNDFALAISRLPSDARLSIKF